MSWDVVDLRAWELSQQETEGDNEKQWYIEPSTGHRWLFKPNRPDRSPFESHAEVIASRIAQLLNVPAAQAELASLGDSLGCISKNVLAHRDNQEIRPDQILAMRVESYEPKAKIRVGHNRTNIVEILQSCRAPKAVEDVQGLSALDWFVAYLFFDALIGNVDRHSSNWALEFDWSDSGDPCIRLAPSFDHASSLGVSMRDRGLDRLMARPDGPAEYPLKAKASRFEDGIGVSLVDYATSYLPHCTEDGRRRLERQFTQVPLGEITSVIGSANLSPASTTLANTLIRTNAERISRCLSQ
ncbi:hypothetical protein GCM10027403_07980 [Arthrobacter tecti]